MNNWKPRAPLTQEEINQLLSSIQLRSTPEDPCAKYPELLKMKSRYRVQFGEGQLYKDYKLAQQRLGKE
jgi:hypothetical protein